MSKWSKSFWVDFGERVGTTAIYGLITFFTLDGTTSLDVEKLYPVVVLPVVLSALKALLVNLSSSTTLPTASLVQVSSTKTKEG